MYPEFVVNACIQPLERSTFWASRFPLYASKGANLAPAANPVRGCGRSFHLLAIRFRVTARNSTTMAGDTRDNALPSNTPPQSRPADSLNEGPYQGKIYETFHVPATPENANALPGGTTNTAGGRPKEAGLIDAAKSVKLEELTEVHKKPCVRDSLITGIGTSFGVGGIRAILGGGSPFRFPREIGIERLTDESIRSFRLDLMQLGRGHILFQFLPHVRVLPTEKAAGDARHEAGRRDC